MLEHPKALNTKSRTSENFKDWTISREYKLTPTKQDWQIIGKKKPQNFALGKGE